jgi:hypothetical protein
MHEAKHLQAPVAFELAFSGGGGLQLQAGARRESKHGLLSYSSHCPCAVLQAKSIDAASGDVEVALGRAAHLMVHNRNAFLDTSGLRFSCCVATDGGVLEETELEIDCLAERPVPPCASLAVPLPRSWGETLLLPRSLVYAVRVTAVLAHDAPWAPAGHVVVCLLNSIFPLAQTSASE